MMTQKMRGLKARQGSVILAVLVFLAAISIFVAANGAQLRQLSQGLRQVEQRQIRQHAKRNGGTQQPSATKSGVSGLNPGAKIASSSVAADSSQ